MLTPNALPDDAVARFKLEFATNAPLAAGDRIGVAVSGGADSVALLLLAHAAFPGNVEAATVDHRLRPESIDEARAVAELCAALDIAHETLTLGKLPSGNVSATARAARYATLLKWLKRRGLSWLLTGHHADDQVETMIMRLNRGSGVAGLSGVRRWDGPVFRPLLGWTHENLIALLRGADVPWIEDPSNGDDRFDRARLRKVLKPVAWIDARAFAQSAAALDEANQALSWSAAQVFAQRVTLVDGVMIFDARALPAELLRRVTSECLRKINSKAVCEGRKVTRLLAALGRGEKATLDGVLCEVRGQGWAFWTAPPRRATGAKQI